MLLAALFTIALSSLAAPAQAFAAPSQTAVQHASFQTSQPVQAASPVRTSSIRCTSTGGATTEAYLPVQRWSDHTSFHSREGWGISGVLNGPMETIVSIGIGWGNLAWSFTTSFVEFAYEFCPINSVGGVMDAAFHDITRAVIDSYLLVALVVVAVIAWAMKVGKAEGGQVTKGLMQKVAVVGLMVIMMTGAANSTGGGIDGTDQNRRAGVQMTPDEVNAAAATEAFQPGFGSPGWFITTIDSVTADVSQALVQAISATPTVEGTSTAATLTPTYNPKSPYSCEKYVRQLEKQYGVLVNRSGTANASVAMALNTFWKQSGLEAWKRVQFGTNSNYGNIVWCRMLEENRRTPSIRSTNVGPNEQLAQSQGMAPAMKDSTRQIQQGYQAKNVRSVAKSTMWYTGGSDPVVSMKMVAWAACANDGKAGQGKRSSKLGWYLPRDRQVLFRDDPDGNRVLGALENVAEDITGESENMGSIEDGKDSCTTLFSKSQHKELLRWDWGNGESNLNNIDTSVDGAAEAKQFLRHLHGSKGFDGFITSVAYAISSTVLAVVFVAFGASIMFAKLLGILMIIGVLGALIWSLLPNSDMSKIFGWFKQYVGVSFYAFAAGLLLSLVTLITGVLISFGNAALPGGAGGVMSLMWTGLAPALAFLTLNWMFKRMSIPSPMSFKAAGAWGQAAAGGNLGSAVMGGVAGGATAGLISKWGNRGKELAKDKAKTMLPGQHRLKEGAGKQGLAPDERPGETGPTPGGAASVAVAGGTDSTPGGAGGSGTKSGSAPLDGETGSGTGTGSENGSGTKKSIGEKLKDKKDAKATEADLRKEFQSSPEGRKAKEKASGAALWKSRAGGLKSAIGKRIKDVGSSTMKNLKTKPVRTLAKGAAFAGLGAVALGTAPLAAMAVGGAALLGKKNLADGTKRGIRSVGATLAGGVSGAREALKPKRDESGNVITDANGRPVHTPLKDVVAAARERAAENRAWEGSRGEKLEQHAQTLQTQAEDRVKHQAELAEQAQERQRLVVEQQQLVEAERQRKVSENARVIDAPKAAAPDVSGSGQGPRAAAAGDQGAVGGQVAQVDAPQKQAASRPTDSVQGKGETTGAKDDRGAQRAPQASPKESAPAPQADAIPSKAPAQTPAAIAQPSKSEAARSAKPAQVLPGDAQR